MNRTCTNDSGVRTHEWERRGVGRMIRARLKVGRREREQKGKIKGFHASENYCDPSRVKPIHRA